MTSVPLDREARSRHGNPTGVHFRDGQVLLYRYMDAMDGRPGGDRFVEIFDTGRTNLQGIPDSRVPIKSVPRERLEGFALIDDLSGGDDLYPRQSRPKAPCAEAALLDGRGLVAVDGRLTYRFASPSHAP